MSLRSVGAPAKEALGSVRLATVARVRMSEQDRRRALLSTAAELAREHGLARVTGRDVAARAGVSVGLVQYHFGSVEELLVELFEQEQGQDLAAAREAINRCRTPSSAIRRLFDWFAPTPADWRYRLWVDAWSLAPHLPLLRTAARRLNLEWRDLFLEVITHGCDTGEFEVPDPKAAAWRIMSLLDAMHIQLSNEQLDASTRTVRSWVRSAIEAELGLRPRP
jgi:AcrR family transcriptional regulator